ncbi:unnamed protein product [Linum tenue]|uniref:Uncharacterized protein n=1 Tax=Linum tenue TaxID=586396 RepID=A0AAV0NID2_9ROSI|nr:unnamed protein product [Linum tenue]
MVGKVHNGKQNPHGSFQVKKGKPSLVQPAPAAENGKGNLYFLSNVDDDLTITRTLYCFKSGGPAAAEVIRNALSKVLVHYYPLAGRLVVSPEGRFAVNCTGEGVVFVEAEADCTLDDVDFSKPDKVTRGKLVLYDVQGVRNKFEIPLMAQVTKFECGGFVLGISFNHVLVDGQAAVEFIVSWAETARGLPISVPPFLDRTILRARTPPKIEFHHPEFIPIEDKSSSPAINNDKDTICKYIKFTPQIIQTAKSKTTGRTGPTTTLTKPCSTFEALAAFVWRARTRALEMEPDQLTRILLVVNTRGKFEPPLPKGYFGNAIKFAPAHSLAGELIEKPLSYAVARIQEAVRSVNDGLLRSAIDYREAAREKKRFNGYGVITVSQWSSLSFSSTDFGWGEPFLSEPVETAHTIVVLGHPTEKGSFNVLVALPVSAMERFEELVEEELCG